MLSAFMPNAATALWIPKQCFLQNERNDTIVALVRDFLNEFQIPLYDEETHTGLVRHILTRIGRSSGEVMVCIVLNGKRLPAQRGAGGTAAKDRGHGLHCAERGSGENKRHPRQKNHHPLGKDTITDSLDGIEFEISPLSFYQVNPVQTEVLYEKAVELADLKGTKRCWILLRHRDDFSFLRKKGKAGVRGGDCARSHCGREENAEQTTSPTQPLPLARREGGHPRAVSGGGHCGRCGCG